MLSAIFSSRCITSLINAYTRSIRLDFQLHPWTALTCGLEVASLANGQASIDLDNLPVDPSTIVRS